MRLIALRHGETEWNREGREMGHLDSPLSARRRAQIEALACRLRAVEFDHLYSSDLPRAVQTAAHVAAVCGKEARIDIGLRERHMGVLQGLTRDEARSRYPELVAAYERDGFYDTIPGGETALERIERSARVLSAIAARHANSTVVVVTHGGFLTGFLEFVLDLPPGGKRRFMKHHGSFNSFEWREAGWRLETWNDVSHLAHLPEHAPA